MGHTGHEKSSKGPTARRGVVACAAVALFLLAFVSQALAAPNHPRLEALDITGFNHACGAAVDSEGDVYVASAGESKVKVFDPAHKLLASIEDTNEPCGLAVDSKGNVYVSEAKTGDVVKYAPNLFPFVGTPTYGVPTTVDSSGKAKGISVDSFDDRLFVAEGDHVAVFNSNGTSGIDEVQQVAVSGNTTGGSFALVFAGQATAPIAYDAGTATVQASLEALSNIDPGDVAVSEKSAGLFVEFRSAYASTNVPQLETASSLTPNTIQKVTVNATAGTYNLEFKGQVTAPVAYNAPASKGEGVGSVEAALEALSNVAPGDVSVSGGPGGAGGTMPYSVEFIGAYAGTAVDNLVPSTKSLSGTVNVQTTTQGANVKASTITPGWNGRIGDGEFAEAGGVGAYTYAGKWRYLFVADRNGTGPDSVDVFSGPKLDVLKERRTLDGTSVPNSAACPKCSEGFGFGAVTPGIAVDAHSGHFFAYDSVHNVVDEFDAPGEYLDQVTDAGLADAKPVGIATVADADEIQRLDTNTEKSGTYTLSFAGKTTPPIAADASRDEIQAVLEALPSIGAGNVAVSGQYSTPLHGARFVISFRESLGHRNVPQLTGDGSNLSGLKLLAIETEVQGSGPGRLYVTSGSGAAARLLTFGPLPTPSRAEAPGRSHVLKKVRAIAADAEGDVYASGGSQIQVFGPTGTELTKIQAPEPPHGLAVDSTGRVYALFVGEGRTLPPESEREKVAAEYKVQYYTPASYPPKAGTKYSGPVTVATGNSLPVAGTLSLIAVNRGNDHVFVYGSGFTPNNVPEIIEIDSAAHGSAVLNPKFASGLDRGFATSIAVDGRNGHFYFSENTSRERLLVVDSTGTEVLARIDGAGSARGKLPSNPQLAVDESNGHVLTFDAGDAIREYDASGAFVGEFGQFGLGGNTGVAVDPNGNVYLAFDEEKPGTPDIWAFDPLAYGEPPHVVTGVADGFGGGSATLHGTVDPRGFSLEGCRFDYLTDAQYIGNGRTFAGASSKACVPSLAEIGHGTGAVEVHTDLSGLVAGQPYRFRLVAANKYGSAEGNASLFGAPTIATRPALPVSYGEATLRAGIDPTGMATKYHFEYGKGVGEYDQSTPVEELPPGETTVEVAAALSGLAEGATYHFRAVAENEAMTTEGPDQTFSTLQRRQAETCANVQFRTGLSANLPECRAYELVMPAETGGALIGAPFETSSNVGFNNWLTVPRGPAAGRALTFATSATLPGYLGSGVGDGYVSSRGEGEHPSAGWKTELVSPSYAQAGGSAGGAAAHDGSSDQAYSLWHVDPHFEFEGTLPRGTYLRTPAGFEAAGQGSLGTDLEAESRFLSAGGTHLIFSSDAHLEPKAAPQGTEAIYDRPAGGETAEVVSLKPGNSPFGSGEDATFVAASEDGAAVALKVGGTLYLRRNGETTEIAAGPSAFAGISEDGERAFYAAAASGSSPAPIFLCDTGTGPCAGAGAHPAVQLAPSAVFVNVSADGSHAFFTSKEALTGTQENENGESAVAGKRNLYAWDGTTHFVGQLDPADFEGFRDNPTVRLSGWSEAHTAASGAYLGQVATRSTPDGAVFAFQSHARLTAYENEGVAEIYRYDPLASGEERLICVSCDPSGAPAESDAQFEDLGIPAGKNGVVSSRTIVPNVTDDGARIFFESLDRLLPEDANRAQDVYRWQANEAGGCHRQGGCLALVSSGQGEYENFLYSMSADGHDVFISTLERLLPQDVAGSISIYDARVDGGIPNPVAEAPCQGDACQGNGSPAPVLPEAATTGAGEGNEIAPGPAPCAKGKRRVKGRCRATHHKRRRHHKRTTRANHARGTGR